MHPARKKQKRNHTPWRVVDKDYSQRDTPQWKSKLPHSDNIRSPISYFRDFFDSEILEHIVEQSNLYAIQRNPNRPLNIDKNELEQFLGTLFLMSLTKISRSRLYWASDFVLPAISKYFSRNRWEFIKTCLHCNDNDRMLTREDPNYDPLFKVRPLLNHLKKKYMQIPIPQMVCIDEQLVPFKGKSQMKQYIPSKPHKWGYKIFALCDTAGILYNFEVYTGKISPVEGEPDLGASSNIVLHLAKSIPEGLNNLLYFDNWFTSIPLVVHLAKKNIYCLATVRINRVPNISSYVLSDKELLKKGRGSYIEVSSAIEGVDMRIVKWADNKCVTLVSSFSSASPVGSCQRFDRKQKKKVEIQCPTIVKTYNSFMGGVDLMDSLIALYRISLRSKKYYQKLIFHFLDASLVNSWLIYKRDCDSMNVPKKEIMTLQYFKHSVAQSLLLEGKPHPGDSKLGRPRRSVDALHLEKKRKANRTSSIPEQSVRKDGSHHWPGYGDKQMRCKMPGCNKRSCIYCTKCNTYLCFTRERNCFTNFHM